EATLAGQPCSATTRTSVHCVDANGDVVLRHQLKRRYVLTFFQKPPPCLVGIEACASPIIGRGNFRHSATPSPDATYKSFADPRRGSQSPAAPAAPAPRVATKSPQRQGQQ